MHIDMAIIILFISLAILFVWYGQNNNFGFIFLCTLGILCVVAIVMTVKHTQPKTLENFDQGDPKLDTLPQDMQDRATLYISSLGSNSYSDTSVTWTDITNNNRNFTFAQQPTFDYLRNGLHIKNISITGPESVDMGIRGMDDYSIVWYGLVQNIIPDKSALEFFTMYANTWSNLGIQIGFGNNSIVIRTNADGDKEPNENIVNVDALQSYNLFAVTKSSGKITVYQGSQEKGSFDIGNADILFSNKHARVNGGGALDMKLCALGVYKKAITPEDLGGILSHIEKRRVELHESFVEIWQEKTVLENNAKCPLKDDSVCKNACSLVDNWNDSVTVMKNATPECKTQISGYCATNSGSDPFCECWAPSNDGKAECGFVKSFFSNDLTPKQSCPTQAGGSGSSVQNLSKYYTDIVFNESGVQDSSSPQLNISKVDNVFGVDVGSSST